jgi:hypothetical protein
MGPTVEGHVITRDSEDSDSAEQYWISGPCPSELRVVSDRTSVGRRLESCDVEGHRRSAFRGLYQELAPQLLRALT